MKLVLSWQIKKKLRYEISWKSIQCGLLRSIGLQIVCFSQNVSLDAAPHHAADCVPGVISLHKQLNKLLQRTHEHLSKHLALALNTANEIFTQAAADSLRTRQLFHNLVTYKRRASKRKLGPKVKRK
jgi:hypothetical protein